MGNIKHFDKNNLPINYSKNRKEWFFAITKADLQISIFEGLTFQNNLESRYSVAKFCVFLALTSFCGKMAQMK